MVGNELTGEEVPNYPRFTLKALLGVTAVLCVPLAFTSAGSPFGPFYLLPVTGGCVGYLAGGWRHVITGFLVGLLVVMAVTLNTSL